ncbi:MAG TPA: SprB repeat-containing protein, partial [Bacteroidia bacterium]
MIVVFILPRTSFSQLNLFPTITNATCPDSSNGSISLTVTGGTAPYTYLWTPGGKTISSVTGLVSGTYSLSVTDNAGNSSTASYVVGPAPFEDGANIKEPVCTMNGEIILVTSGGTGALTYQWSTGATTQFITEAGPG